MKLGFSIEEATAMWKPLWKEAREVFNYSGPGVKFIARRDDNSEYVGWDTGTIASTWFGKNKSMTILDHATMVTLNPVHRKLMYEDELRAVLLHEAAHAVGAFSDAHYSPWKLRAKAIGTPPEEMFLIRNYKKLPYLARVSDEFADRIGGPTMDKYK